MYSQSPGNVYNPGAYSECNPSAIYKKFYSRPINLDTLVKPLAVLGQRVWRIIDLKEIEAQKVFKPFDDGLWWAKTGGKRKIWNQSKRVSTLACSVMPITLKKAATSRLTSENCTAQPSD